MEQIGRHPLFTSSMKNLSSPENPTNPNYIQLDISHNLKHELGK